MSSCIHCKLPTINQEKFCCKGCEIAFNIIKKSGFKNYYQKRILNLDEESLKPDEDYQHQKIDLTYFITEINPNKDQHPQSQRPQEKESQEQKYNEYNRYTQHNRYNQHAESEKYYEINLLIKRIHCAACVWLIESLLLKQKNVISARVNMSTKRLTIKWQKDKTQAESYIELINKIGYIAIPFDAKVLKSQEKQEEKLILRSLAISFFATGNIMLFSIALWSMSDISGDILRKFFHWISFLITAPTVIFAGRIFFHSAFSALTNKRTNIDVPISVALILTTILSFIQIFKPTGVAYFESSVMLLFFLLIGRYLSVKTQNKARSIASDFLLLQSSSATIIDQNSELKTLHPSQLKEGMILQIAKGEKIPADSEITKGTSDIDEQLISGEVIPKRATIGNRIFAGTINLTAPINAKIINKQQNSLISQITKLIEQAEMKKARYLQIADKIAKFYTPFVHILAATAFIIWFFIIDISFLQAILIATAVLIITCPCALALAAPIVHTLTISKLMQKGIVTKSVESLEKIAKTDVIIFDKTGTLTSGKLNLRYIDQYDPKILQIINKLSLHSKHPLCLSFRESYANYLCRSKKDKQDGTENSINHSINITNIEEIGGFGIKGEIESTHIETNHIDHNNNIDHIERLSNTNSYNQITNIIQIDIRKNKIIGEKKTLNWTALTNKSCNINKSKSKKISEKQSLKAEKLNQQIFLGRYEWCLEQAKINDIAIVNQIVIDIGNSNDKANMWFLYLKNKLLIPFYFSDKIYVESKEAIASLKKQIISEIILLSGDEQDKVRNIAEKLKIDKFYAQATPIDKLKLLQKLQKQKKQVIMIGDGLNDSASLAEADISISPTNAIDLAQNTADIVFPQGKISSILTIINIAKFAHKLVIQNFLFTLLYNLIVIPIAILGYATPLIAVISMSCSSLIVTLNSFRLYFKNFDSFKNFNNFKRTKK